MHSFACLLDAASTPQHTAISARYVSRPAPQSKHILRGLSLVPTYNCPAALAILLVTHLLAAWRSVKNMDLSEVAQHAAQTPGAAPATCMAPQRLQIFHPWSRKAHSSSKSTSSLELLSMRAAMRSRSLCPLGVIARPPLVAVLLATTSTSSSYAAHSIRQLSGSFSLSAKQRTLKRAAIKQML